MNNGVAMLGEAALGMVQGFVNQFFGKRAANYQYQLSEKAVENAYERQLNFWAKQNAYNDPSNVKNRLMQSGINPATMSAQNAVPAGQLSNAPQANPDGYTAPNVQINSFVDTLKTLAESNFISEETQVKAQELLNQQIQQGINEALRAKGWSDARLAELDRRAKWKALYGEDSDVPANPFWGDDANQYISDSRNPVATAVRKTNTDSEGQHFLNQINFYEMLNKKDMFHLFQEFGIDYNTLPSDVQTQVGLCMASIRYLDDVINVAEHEGSDTSEYSSQRMQIKSKLLSIIDKYHSQSKAERSVRGMPSVDQLLSESYRKISSSQFVHRISTSARDDLHKWYTSVLDYFGISH